MGNEISSDASNNVKSKLGQMTTEELRNRRKMAEKYIQIINTELKSRRGNSKTSNKLVVSKNKKPSKQLEKKSKSGGKKSTTSSTQRKINASKKFIIEFLEKKKIQYVKGYNKPYYEKLVIEHKLITKVENEFKKKKNK